MQGRMEYQELRVPDDVLTRLEKLQEVNDPKNPATLGNSGFFDWVNQLARDEGWRVVWTAFNFPYLVLERLVVVEEVEK